MVIYIFFLMVALLYLNSKSSNLAKGSTAGLLFSCSRSRSIFVEKITYFLRTFIPISKYITMLLILTFVIAYKVVCM